MWTRAVVMMSWLCLAGCSSCSSSNDATTTDGATAAGGLSPEEAQKVLAKVGERTITLGDFAAVLERLGPYERMRYQAPERRKELLEDMITVELLAAEAIAKGYDKDPMTQLEVQNALRDAMLADLRKGAQKPEDIPEPQVRAWYEEHTEMFRDPERRRLSAIAVPSRAVAEKLITELSGDDSAARFGQLVREKSTLPDAKADLPLDLAGDLGIVSPPGDDRGANPRVPEPVRVALFALGKVGEVSAVPVEVGGSFYVLRLTQVLEARARTYQEAERSIRVRLAQLAMEKREDELIETLKKTIPVHIDDSALEGVRMPEPQGGVLMPSHDHDHAGHDHAGHDHDHAPTRADAGTP